MKEGAVVSRMGARAKRAADDINAFCLELFAGLMEERDTGIKLNGNAPGMHGGR